MERQEKADRRHRLPAILTMAGLLVICGGFASSRLLRASNPGKLVPRQELLTWQSPSEKEFRTLSIDEAQATFELENIGGSPVRIVEAQSSCGCAIPELPATPIGPGEVRPFKVKAVPLQTGERMASITLKTDSPASPEIVLRLRAIGSRRPPYMAQANGSLSFSGDPSNESQEIIAYQVELAGSKPLPPVAKSDLSILKITPAALMEEQAYMTAESVLRKYRLMVSLGDRLPQGA